MDTNHDLQGNPSERRGFLKRTAGALGAAAVAGASLSQAQTAVKGKEERKNSRKLKIGVFGLDYSFWPGLWADLLSPTGKYSGTGLFNMEPTHVWDKDIKKAENFALTWGCEVVNKYDGMLGKVDGVVNGDLYNVPWQHKMFRPYIEAGVPTFLSRPWSSKLRDLEYMLELAAKHNTPLTATTPYEHYNEADSFKARLAGIGEIEAVFASCAGGDHPHFHIPYMMMKILGYNVEQVSLMTNDPKSPRYMQDTYIYKTSGNQPQFVLTMHRAMTYVFNFTVVGKNGSERAMMPAETNYFYRFAPQLIDIQKTLEGESYQTFDVVRKKFEVFITEYYSHYERGGAPVMVGTVSPDWTYPLWKPDWYNNSDFKD